MKVYLAGMYSTIADVRKRREELATLGIECTSRWLEETNSPNSGMKDFPPSFFVGTAGDDVEDIRRADMFVLFSVDGTVPTPRGGRHFETGYAYAIGKPVVICGPKENIFHYLPDVYQFETFEEVKEWLRSKKYLAEQKHFRPSEEKTTRVNYASTSCPCNPLGL